MKYLPKEKLLTYVEPFMGGASFGLRLLYDKRIIKQAIFNDIDSDLIKFWNDVQNGSIVKDYPDIDNLTIETAKNLYNKIIKQGFTKGWEFLFVNRLSWCGIIRSGFNQDRWNKGYSNCLNRVILSKNLLNSISTKIYNSDYQEIMKKYDSKHTFFYLDPPYFNVSKKIYIHESFDFQKLANFLKTIKGKFILSLNDKPEVHEWFKDFNIYKHQWLHTMRNFNNQSKTGYELIITNYQPNFYQQEILAI
ncbi:MAG: DNA adenine methylase [Spiroplasma sp.]